jgi:hypothetical protein
MSSLHAFIWMFMAAVTLHLAILRGTERLSRRPISTLLVLFAATFVVGAAFWVARGRSGGQSNHALWPLVHVAETYFACALVYILTYLGLFEDSPSVTMVRYVDLAGPSGRGDAEFGQLLRDEDLLHPRIASMATDGLIVLRDGRWHGTKKGRRFEGCFGLWARLFRVGQGG